jgi:VCBS repeat-containing protein
VDDDRLVFDYGRIGLVTKAQDPATGALTTVDSFGFDLAGNVAINPTMLPKPVAGTTLPAATATKFFLLIDGLKGDSQDAHHAGWFEIAGFDLDVSNLADASGGGGGAGKATFSPLSIAMAADGALSALLADAASGKHITSIRLEGVTEGKTQEAVYDLTLADVLVQRVHDSDGVEDDRLVFDYGRIGLVTKAQNPVTGALTTVGSFGFDLVANGVIDPAMLPKPVAGTTLPAAAATKFFLLIDGLKGDSQDAHHAGWFEIAGFDLDVSNLTDVSGGGGGGGTGKATFSPLSIAMAADGALSALLADAATGKHLTSIKLEGVATGPKGEASAVYDLTLADVLVQRVHDSDGVDDDRLVFDYGRIGLVTKAQDPVTGALTTVGSFGFDLVGNVAIDPATLPRPTTDVPLEAELVSTTTHGQLTLHADGSFIYVPDSNFNGEDFFVYRARQGNSLSDEVTVKLIVAPVNDAPVASNVLGETNEDTHNPITLTALFTDIDVGDTHTFQIDTTGTKGLVVNNGNGTFTYDPNGAFESLGVGETAQDSFEFKVTDNSGAFSTAIATITIHGENDAPLPAADFAAVRPGNVVSVAAANGVLSNDHDPDANDKLSVTGVKFENTIAAVAAGGSAEVKGAYGTLTIHSDGSFAYAANKTVPSQGLAQDKFEYVVSDGHNGMAQATLTVTLAKDGYVLGAPGDILTGGTGKQVLDGSLGQQQLLGGNGKDVLVGGPGDVLTGGNGPDTFVFGKAFGHVTISDFDTHIDMIQFSKGLFPDIASILNHVTSDGHGGATISVDQDNSISLLGVNPMTLQKGDFLIL